MLGSILNGGLCGQGELGPLGARAEKFPGDALSCRPAPTQPPTSSRPGTSRVTSFGASRPRRPISAVCGWAAAALSVSTPFALAATRSAGCDWPCCCWMLCLFGGPSSGDARDRWRENPGARSIWGEPRGHQPGTFPQKRRSPRRGVVLSRARLEPQHLGLQKVSGYSGGAGRPAARTALLSSCPSASFWAAVFEAADTLRASATALPWPPP